MALNIVLLALNINILSAVYAILAPYVIEDGGVHGRCAGGVGTLSLSDGTTVYAICNDPSHLRGRKIDQVFVYPYGCGDITDFFDAVALATMQADRSESVPWEFRVVQLADGLDGDSTFPRIEE